MDRDGWALGMIETVGFAGLVASADAAAKAADVRVVTYQGADAGIVTIYLVGGVASVRAAVAAGVEAARRVGQLRAGHVIPRPVPDIVLLEGRLFKEGSPTVTANMPDLSRQAAMPVQHAPARGEDSVVAGIDFVQQKEQQDDERLSGDLMNEPVAKLRKLARSVKGFPLSSAEISLARKKDLVRLLTRLRNERSEEEA